MSDPRLTISPAPSSVHAQILGPSFAQLPHLLRSIHDGRTRKRYAGRCSVTGGRGWIARAIRRLASLPRAGDDVPLTVVIERRDTAEAWIRTFGDHEMRSVIRLCPHGLEERLGPVALTFALRADGDRIVWQLRRARLLFLPLPVFLFTGCGATEAVADGRYCFDVRAEIGGIGLLVHYKGWLLDRDG